MRIIDMFEKDIKRNIKGVIKVDQSDEDNIYQELDEYVVTKELSKHFTEFFSNYSKGLFNPTDDMGVWISGFFGSGKSHFLKILSYILDSNLTVKNRKPIDFFKDDGKINDSVVIGNMESSTNVDTDVILFNIDSKSAQSEKKDILNVFIKVFNEMQGYCGGIPFIAALEKKLDEENKYSLFKEEFEKQSGGKWEDLRDEFFFNQDEVIKAIVNIGFMSEESARIWAEKAENNMDISIENFAREVNNYCEVNNRRILFLVDEVGQFIAEDTGLMLNLQTIVEQLGIQCQGKVWVVVTSQQNIDEITKDIRGIDFSKIQGRFKTKLSLSSSNVDEVIRRRILAKNKNAQDFLELQYAEIEPTLKNIMDFDGTLEMKIYENAEDFANIYPFVPYQFNRVQEVLTSIREHSASGKHMADGERSMLALFQESAISMGNKTDGALVPFNLFYNAVEEFIDHTHKIVINHASENNSLHDFDVEVLKVLFMIKYVKGIKSSSKNLTTLMITSIHEDRVELNKKIDSSLKRLLEQTLIQKNGDVYSFLTNEEQDINREIKNQIVDSGEILDEAFNRIFGDIYPLNKYKVSSRYNFAFNRAIDEREKNSKGDIGIRIITPYYEDEITSNLNSGQLQLDNAGQDSFNILRSLSDKNNEVIIKLSNDLTVFDEIKENLQISKYLKMKSADMNPELRARKQEEYKDKNERIKNFLEDAIKHAIIFVKGDKVDIVEKNAHDRLDEAMGKLVDKVYNKLSYMTFEVDKNSILETLKDTSKEFFNYTDNTCLNALDDLDDYVLNQFNVHSNPKLKEIIIRFSKAPYGFTKLDIQWLVAKLFVQKRISLILHGEELSIKFNGVDEILNYLTKNEFSEQLLISKREETNINYIKSVKEVLKEAYEKTVTIDDDERLIEIFKPLNKEKCDEINKCLIEFRSFDKYPGKKLLEEAYDLLNQINNKKPSEFFKFIYDNEDDLIDIIEDIYPIIKFFNSKQREIFKESYDIYINYESNKNLIQNKELDEIAMTIKKILDMKQPYSNIKDLPQLNSDFNQKFEIILVEKRQIVKNDLDKDLEIVNSHLNSEDLENKYKNQFDNSFNNLNQKLNAEKNISIINGISEESNNLRINCLVKINNYNKIKTGTEQSTIPISKEETISIKNILSNSRVMIKSEEDLDIFFNKIKEKVKNELENDKIVYLKF